jgi:hypothetical protein
MTSLLFDARASNPEVAHDALARFRRRGAPLDFGTVFLVC